MIKGSGIILAVRFARYTLLAYLAIFTALWTSTAHAQNSSSGIHRKSLDLNPSASNPYEFSLGSTVDDILQDTSDTNLYDPITIGQLRLLKEDAQPSWEPDDIDPYKTRRVVQKAFAIQFGRSISRQIMQSDLRETYRYSLQAYKRLQEVFRYSLQSDGESLAVSRLPKGRKLLELNMEFNVKQGFDPQIRIGDSLRFRYDYVYDRTLLEFGFNF